MGVDYYNCDICGNIFPDCGSYENCEGCERSWCSYCVDNEENHTFLINDEPRCELCFSTKPPNTATDAELLEFLLQSLNRSREEVFLEWQKAQPLASYMCEHCEIENCDNLAKDWLDKELRDANYEKPWNRRGRCCVLVHNYKDEDEWCDACRARVVRDHMEEPMEPIFAHHRVPKDVRKLMYKRARDGEFGDPLLESWEKRRKQEAEERGE